MSLAALCNITTAIIKRVASVNDSAMGQNRAYTTASRGTLPTSTTGRINEVHSQRRFAFMQHDSEVEAVWFTKTNPQCGDNAQDQLVIGGTVWFVQWQKNPDEVGVYYALGLQKFGMGAQ